MELFLIPIGIATGLAFVFFFMWRRAETKLADAEALALDLYETNEKLQEAHDNMKERHWKLLVNRNEFEQGGKAEGALNSGDF